MERTLPPLLPPPLPCAAEIQPPVIPSGPAGPAVSKSPTVPWSVSTVITVLYATAVLPPIGMVVGLFALVKSDTRRLGLWLLAMSVAYLLTWLVFTPIGGILFCLIFTSIVTLSKPPKCGRCGQPLPKFRMATNSRQALFGGATCPYCGAEVDRKGRVRAPSGPAAAQPPALAPIPPPLPMPPPVPPVTANEPPLIPPPPSGPARG
jgi:DNA-directed RNA polymerase subunit RPC12/RpoP